MSKSEKLLSALWKGKLVEAIDLINQMTELELCQADELGYTPLHLSVRDHGCEILKILLTKVPQSNINSVITMGNTVLHESALHNNIHSIKLLLPRLSQSTIDSTNELGETSLLVALDESTSRETVELLINITSKEALTIQDDLGNMALHRTAYLNNSHLTKLLLAKMPLNAIDTCDIIDKTPLDIAICKNHSDITEILQAARAKLLNEKHDLIKQIAPHDQPHIIDQSIDVATTEILKVHLAGIKALDFDNSDS